jgi:hypothetical protein
VAGSEEIQKLLGLILAAVRPESTAYSTSHDYTIIIAVCHDIG